MHALENKVIIYDDVCPLCQAYTAGFVRFGWLKYRTGFVNANAELLQHLDLDRARHEIPLYDTQTKETLYGLDALFLILGTRYPLLRPLFGSRLFRAPLKQLYQIITYNRRVIAGTQAPEQGFDCAPDVNLFYRWLYIVLALASVIAILYNHWVTSTVWLLLAGLQVVVLGIGLALREDKLSVLGHWATVSLAAAIVATWHPAAGMLVAVFLWQKRWSLVGVGA